MFEIRKASVEDAAEFSNIKIASWRAAYKGIVPGEYLDNMNPDTAAQKFIEILGSFPDTLSYLAYNDGKSIGILTTCKAGDANDETGEIMAIYLLPEAWGQGFGRKMMDFAVKTLSEAGYKHIVLWTLEENARARKFYERAGFIHTGGKKEMEIGKPLTVIEYLLDISI